MLNRIKTFYNKDDFNYSEGLVDPFEFHKTFYRMLVKFRVAKMEDMAKSKWLNQNTAIFVTGFLGALQIFISLCRGIYIFDILDITEAGAFFIVLFYELLIQTCPKLNVPQYTNLLNAMQDDFRFICTEGAKYRHKYFENQVVTWKICIFASIFTASVGIGIVLFTSLLLLLYLLTHEPGNREKRPLLFPYWLGDINFGETPYYEIAFSFANLCAVLYAYNYIFMLQTQIVWIRHVSSKVDIVVWSIQDLLEDVYPTQDQEKIKYFSDLLQNRLRKIVMHHQTMLSVMEDYAIVYKKLLMFEQKCCASVVCFTAYCTVTRLERDGEIQPVLVILCVGTTVVHFIPSYFCTFLAEKVSSVCDACWSIDFWTAGQCVVVMRPYMIVMMQRAMRPIPLGVPGFEPMSIETFSKKMTSAYSLFNMLRQTDL